MNNLKPVVFVQGDCQFYRQNEYAQNILLKSISEGITDPNELRKLAGFKSAAEVYRTLDKLSLRREYHDALARSGLTLDEVISGIKEICHNGDSDTVKLKAWQTVLRSLGLDKYENVEEAGKNWEELILGMADKNIDEMKQLDGEVSDYEVIRPAVPKEEKDRQDRERAIGKELYEH